MSQHRAHWSVAAFITLPAGLVVWGALLTSRDVTPVSSAVEADAGVLARSEELDAPTFLTSPPMSAQPSTALESAAIVGAHPRDPEEPGMLPHPITPEHERIFAENRTIGALNDAMALRDVKEMRKLVAEYRKLDPNDIEATANGYEIIANCIEFPGSTSSAAASQFYDTEGHSPLRRFVRRICFENKD